MGCVLSYVSISVRHSSIYRSKLNRSKTELSSFDSRDDVNVSMTLIPKFDCNKFGST